jgi:hypothetical protein
MKKLKINLDTISEKSKILKKNIDANLKSAKKQSSDIKNELLVDFLIILRMIKKTEECIMLILRKFEVYWRIFKSKVSTRLNVFKNVIIDYTEYLKKSFFRTIKMEKVESLLEKFNPDKLASEIHQDQHLLYSPKLS